MARKENAFENSLMDLKQYCSQLNDETECKLNEKTWNFLIQHFCKKESFHEEATYWYKRIMQDKRLATPNSFTLNAMLKVFSNGSDEDNEGLATCDDILLELERRGQCNVFSYINYTTVCLKNKDLEKAFSVVLDGRLERHNIEPNFGIFIPLLREATNSNNRAIGLKLCDIIKKSGLSSPPLWSCVASFAFKMKLWHMAIEEYEKLKKSRAMMNVVTWNCLIQAHVQQNDIKKAVLVISEMKDHGFDPDSTTFTILLSACAKQQLYEEGKSIHQFAKKTLNIFEMELYNTIINFYTKCGHAEIAIEECEKLKTKGLMDIVSWTCLIQAHIQQNDFNKAIQTIYEMKHLEIELDSTIFTILLSECAKKQLYEEGKSVHELAEKTLNIFTKELCYSIINFYIKCGHPEIAIKESEKFKKKDLMDVFLWNCLIQAHIQQNDIKKAVFVISEMKDHGVGPESATFTMLLIACTNLKLYEEGKSIHQLAKQTLNVFTMELYNTIINFYTKCGNPELAIEECEILKKKGLMDIVTWTCLIQAHIKQNDIKKAIQTISEMCENQVTPNSTTFTILLSACAKQQLYEEGKSIHELAKKTLNIFEMELYNTIINFYTKCGYPEIAINECEKLKKRGLMDVVTWNCLIQAYIQQNDIKKAVFVISEMKDHNHDPDSTTFTILLSACTNLELYDEGKSIHAIAKQTLKEDIEFTNTVINFYTKCGHPEIAIEECEILKKKGLMDIVTWTCLIQAHIKRAELQTQEEGEDGLSHVFRVYQEMKQHVEPNTVTFNVLLSACAEYLASDMGMEIIQDIKLRGMDNNESIVSVMVNFYSRIGQNETAQGLFDKLVMAKNNSKEPLSVITYGNMLSCYGQHGKGFEAQNLFNEMIEKKVELNEIIFIILLNAYSHCGMVNEAIQLYDSMISKFNIKPTRTIDCVMVDVYSRAGRFEEAEKLIGTRTDIDLWGAFMAGCRKFNNIEMGEKVFNKMTNLNEMASSPYILLSHIYTYHGLNEKANRIRDLMQKRGIKKIPGIVYHQENGKVFKFISGSTKYDRLYEVEAMRDEIYRKIIRAGFKPDTRWATNTKLISEEERVVSLCRHAEKTAIAHAFVLNPNRKKIILTKNLRVCNDCHTATAYISKVMEVEIIVRDAKRYHHFKDGKCSCGDYW